MALPLGNPFSDTSSEGGIMGAYSAGNALEDSILKMHMQKLMNQAQQKKMPFIEPMLKEELSKAQQFNKYYGPEKEAALQYQNLINKNYEPNILSEIAHRNALTRSTNILSPLQAEELRIRNQFGAERERSAIDSQKAMAALRNMGGSGMGVGGKDQLMYQNLVARDNPQLKTPEQIYEASNVLATGGNQLSDGTQLNPLSFNTRSVLDRIMKGSTTAPALTANIKARQAEAEIDVLNDYAQKGLEPYGDTLLNMNPQQVVDSFKKDDASQKKLGKFIASQALQYEIAQNRIRLANGQPGVTSTEELMKLSGQMIKTSYPKLSYKARKEASDYMDEALKQGLKARINAGSTPSALNEYANKKEPSSKKVMIRNKKTGESKLVSIEEAKKLGVANV